MSIKHCGSSTDHVNRFKMSVQTPTVAIANAHHLLDAATHPPMDTTALHLVTTAIVNGHPDHHVVAMMTILLLGTTVAEHLPQETLMGRHQEILTVTHIVNLFHHGHTHLNPIHQIIHVPEAHHVLITTIVAAMEEVILNDGIERRFKIVESPSDHDKIWSYRPSNCT